MSTYQPIYDERITYRLKIMGDLWPLFRTPDILWHTTSPERFSRILNTSILPSDGSIESDYPGSLGSYLKSICLFDFSTPAEKDALMAEDSWGSFLVDIDEPGKIFMAIDKNGLDLDYFIHQKHPNFLRMAKVDDRNRFRNQIVHVECWYQKPIQLSSIKKIVLIRKSKHPYQFEVLEFDEQISSRVESIMNNWREAELVKKEEDRKAGKVDLSELLTESWSKN